MKTKLRKSSENSVFKNRKELQIGNFFKKTPPRNQFDTKNKILRTTKKKFREIFGPKTGKKNEIYNVFIIKFGESFFGLLKVSFKNPKLFHQKSRNWKILRYSLIIGKKSTKRYPVHMFVVFENTSRI